MYSFVYLIAFLRPVSDPVGLERSCPVQFQSLDDQNGVFQLVSDSLSGVAVHSVWTQLIVSAIVPALILYLPALLVKKLL